MTTDIHDLQWQAYLKGLEAGQTHTKSSPETKERMAELEKNIHRQLDKKVSYKWLGILIGFFITIVTGMWGLIYNQGVSNQEWNQGQLTKITETAVQTNNSIINLESQLRAKDVIK